MKCSRCFQQNISVHAVSRTIKTRARSANNLFDIFEQMIISLGKISDSVERDGPKDLDIEIDVALHGKERKAQKVEGGL